MTCTGSLKPIKGKWQLACSLMETQTYDTPVMLDLKYITRTFVLAPKSPKDLFLSSLLFNKQQVWCFLF